MAGRRKNKAPKKIGAGRSMSTVINDVEFKNYGGKEAKTDQSISPAFCLTLRSPGLVCRYISVDRQPAVIKCASSLSKRTGWSGQVYCFLFSSSCAQWPKRLGLSAMTVSWARSHKNISQTIGLSFHRQPFSAR